MLELIKYPTIICNHVAMLITPQLALKITLDDETIAEGDEHIRQITGKHDVT